MTTDPKSNEIRQRMSALRNAMSAQRDSIDFEIAGMKKTIRNSLDLKHQVLAHPVMASILTGAIGFFLVPKKQKKSVTVDSDSTEKLIAELREKFNIPAESESKSESHTWTKRSLDFLKGYAVQMVLSQAKKRFAAYLAKMATHSKQNYAATDSKAKKHQFEDQPLHP